jgi:hypothetical protein
LRRGGGLFKYISKILAVFVFHLLTPPRRNLQV